MLPYYDLIQSRVGSLPVRALSTALITWLKALIHTEVSAELASNPAITGVAFVTPLSALSTLTVTAATHKIAEPTTVIIRSQSGQIIMTDVTINPTTKDVSFIAKKPITGFISIS